MEQIGAVDLAACILASYRLTVLFVTDAGPLRIIHLFRMFVGRYTSVLRCAHCTGVWMALGTIILWRLGVCIPLYVLAVAGAQSFMESCLERKFSL